MRKGPERTAGSGAGVSRAERDLGTRASLVIRAEPEVETFKVEAVAQGWDYLSMSPPSLSLK